MWRTLKTSGNNVTRSFLYDNDALVAELYRAGTAAGSTTGWPPSWVTSFLYASR